MVMTFFGAPYIKGAYIAFGLFMIFLPIVMILGLLNFCQTPLPPRLKLSVFRREFLLKWTRSFRIKWSLSIFMLYIAAVYCLWFSNCFYELRIRPTNKNIELLLLFPRRIITLDASEISVKVIHGDKGIGKRLGIKTIEGKEYYSPNAGTQEILDIAKELDGVVDNRGSLNGGGR